MIDSSGCSESTRALQAAQTLAQRKEACSRNGQLEGCAGMPAGRAVLWHRDRQDVQVGARPAGRR